MSAAREQMLARIRAALADVPPREPEATPIPRDYRHTAGPGSVTALAERLEDYRARVRRVSGRDEVGPTVGALCAAAGLRRIVTADGVPDDWRPAGIEVLADTGLSPRELDGIDGALTGCAVAVAQTGTLILDGSAVCGRRVLTLVPDHHICVVLAEQVVGLVPEGIAALQVSVQQRGTPVTLISGPSASSDIELTRVEGVHGPRNLYVVIVDH